MLRQNTVERGSPIGYLCYLFLLALTAALLQAAAFADPVLPTIPAGTFTLPAATGNATTDTANLVAALTAAATSANGGGTVVVLAGTYVCNQFSIPSNIDLQLASGATIQDANPSNTLISVGSGHDIEITGSGTINGNATTTSGNNLINISNVNKLLISGVSINNSSHFHLVPKNITNLTINGVTLNDSNTSLSNTDGIDYSGSHILIENCTVNVGDDDIVAKPQSVYCSDITITGCTIKAGHGISVGGQTNAGLNGLTVSNCTFTGTTNGLRMKAGPYMLDGVAYNNSQGLGGVVQNVSFSNITMTGVAYPIIINSWYVGGDDYGYSQRSPSALHTLTNPGETLHTVDQQNNSTALVPFYDNIRYTNITATGSTNNVAIIYGLDSQPANPGDPQRNIDNVSFNNVHLSGSYGADIYYASRLDLSGLFVTPTTGPATNPYGNSTLMSGYTIWQGGNITQGNHSATDWVNPYNWTSDSTPGGAGIKIAFGNQDPSNSVVDMVSSPKTVGCISFSAGPSSTTIQSSGGYSLTLKNSSGASIIDVSGSQTIAVPVVLNNDVNITGTGNLNLTGGISGAYALNLQGGNLTAKSINVSTLTLAAGSVLTIQAIPGGPVSRTITPVPEPATFILFGIAAVGMLAFAWRRRG